MCRVGEGDVVLAIRCKTKTWGSNTMIEVFKKTVENQVRCSLDTATNVRRYC